MLSAWRRGRWRETPSPGGKPIGTSLALIVGVGLLCGLFGYLMQAAQNRLDAQEGFSEVTRRVARHIVERMHRYEYGLRGARGVAIAADGALTRSEFARYAASRQIDKEFPGARGFGIVLRVPPDLEQDFLRRRRQLDSPDFAIRSLGQPQGDRLVITFVEPEARNREALGLDIGSEPARRAAALSSAQTREATLTAPLTLVQASGHRSGGLLLLLPIHRPGPSNDRWDSPGEELVGWSYAPLLIEDVLRGLNAEESAYSLSLFDVAHDRLHPFFSTGAPTAGDGPAIEQRREIDLYGRRWEAVLSPTPAFYASLHATSPRLQGLLGLLLGSAVAALIATIVQLVDRTRGQRLEQARRAAIVEGSADAIVVQTLDGRITDWNEGAERLFGYSKDETRGRTATALLIPDGLEDEDARLRETVAGGGRVTVFETIRRARDGSRIPVSITAAPIRDDAGTVVGSAKILRDVRDAKAVEQRMRDLNASLEHQVRDRTALLDQAVREARDANEAKSRFLANISHEIRTPMNAVIGMTHLLARTDLNPDQAAMLARIHTAGKTLLALLNDVLDLSKIEARQMTLESTPFHLRQLIEEIASIACISAEERGIAFLQRNEVDEDLVVIGDPTRLGQIVLNLLTNAVKFTAAGQVTLAVHLGEVSASGEVPVAITVSDTGIGIPQDLQQQLFQPFVQADTSTTRRFGGTGLGLSIVRQLTELMGGGIHLRSQPGRGSEFTVRLVLHAADPSTVEHPCAGSLAQSSTASLNGRHILVVDDNEWNREVAARLLRAEGALVTLAENGREALARVRADPHALDAVLMDVQMPVMDGLEATRLIRGTVEGGETLPIIGLTAGVSDGERSASMAAGMDTVVGKPFEPEVLLRVVASRIADHGPPPGHRTERASAAPSPVADRAGDERHAGLDAPPTDWPELPGLSPTLSSRRLGGDPVLLGKMAGSLAQTLATNAALLAGPVVPETWAAHAGRLHDFKAVAGTLGGEALYRAAATAESLLRAGRWNEAQEALDALQTLAAPLWAAVDRQWPDRASVPRGPLPDLASSSPAGADPMPGADDSRGDHGDHGDLATLLARLVV